MCRSANVVKTAKVDSVRVESVDLKPTEAARCPVSVGRRIGGDELEANYSHRDRSPGIVSVSMSGSREKWSHRAHEPRTLSQR